MDMRLDEVKKNRLYSLFENTNIIVSLIRSGFFLGTQVFGCKIHINQ